MHNLELLKNEKKEGLTRRYNLIKTDSMVSYLTNRGWILNDCQIARTRKPDNEGYQKHLLRFYNPELIKTNEERPEIVLINSFDGTTSFIMMIGVFRFVCSNGLIVGKEMMPSLRLIHKGERANYANHIVGELVDRFPAIINKVENLKKTYFDNTQITELAKTATNLRWNNQEENRPYNPMDIFSNLRRDDDNKKDAWTVFNRVQENIVKGGYTIEGTKQPINVRPIKSVVQTVRINRGLWDCMEKLVA